MYRCQVWFKFTPNTIKQVCLKHMQNRQTRSTTNKTRSHSFNKPVSTAYLLRAAMAAISCSLSACVLPRYCHPWTLSGLAWTSASNSNTALGRSPSLNLFMPSSNGFSTSLRGLSSSNWYSFAVSFWKVLKSCNHGWASCLWRGRRHGTNGWLKKIISIFRDKYGHPRCVVLFSLKGRLSRLPSIGGLAPSRSYSLCEVLPLSLQLVPEPSVSVSRGSKLRLLLKLLRPLTALFLGNHNLMDIQFYTQNEESFNRIYLPRFFRPLQVHQMLISSQNP